MQGTTSSAGILILYYKIIMRTLRLSVFHFAANNLGERHLALVLATFLKITFAICYINEMIKRNSFLYKHQIIHF